MPSLPASAIDLRSGVFLSVLGVTEVLTLFSGPFKSFLKALVPSAPASAIERFGIRFTPDISTGAFVTVFVLRFAFLIPASVLAVIILDLGVNLGFLDDLFVTGLRLTGGSPGLRRELDFDLCSGVCTILVYLYEF